MPAPESPDSTNPFRQPLGGMEPSGLISAAFQLRSQHRYALHPVEAALQYHRAAAEIPGEEGHGARGFEQAEAIYRTGTQGLRLPEIPQLPQQLRELSQLGAVDRAGRKTLRKWVEDHGYAFDETRFSRCWEAQGKRGGAEHQVFYALAVIDPYIALARRGTWAAIKLAEIGLPTPPDDPML